VTDALYYSSAALRPVPASVSASASAAETASGDASSGSAVEQKILNTEDRALKELRQYVNNLSADQCGAYLSAEMSSSRAERDAQLASYLEAGRHSQHQHQHQQQQQQQRAIPQGVDRARNDRSSIDNMLGNPVASAIKQWLPDVTRCHRLYKQSEALLSIAELCAANPCSIDGSRGFAALQEDRRWMLESRMRHLSPFYCCQDRPRTLTVVTLTNGTVFGGYISMPFPPDDCEAIVDYHEDLNAFVFSAIPPAHRRDDAPSRLQVAWRAWPEHYRQACANLISARLPRHINKGYPQTTVSLEAVFGNAQQFEFDWAGALTLNFTNPGKSSSLVNGAYVEEQFERSAANNAIDVVRTALTGLPVDTPVNQRCLVLNAYVRTHPEVLAKHSAERLQTDSEWLAGPVPWSIAEIDIYELA